MTLRNSLSELQKVSEHVDEFGVRHGLGPKILRDLTLALEETITNIISYGYTDDGEHEIRVRLTAQPEAVTIEIEDDGRAFNPLEAPAPDLSRPLEDRPVGGLGIHLVRTLTDDLQYRRQGNSNLLVMTKRRGGAGHGD